MDHNPWSPLIAHQACKHEGLQPGERRAVAPMTNDYLGCNCTGARACTLASVCGRAGTGLRAAGSGATDGLGLRFCSETLAIARVICSWFALSCSAIPALSRANSAWLALSCSISC